MGKTIKNCEKNEKNSREEVAGCRLLAELPGVEGYGFQKFRKQLCSSNS